MSSGAWPAVDWETTDGRRYVRKPTVLSIKDNIGLRGRAFVSGYQRP